jgi:hypothetical protein
VALPVIAGCKNVEIQHAFVSASRPTSPALLQIALGAR